MICNINLGWRFIWTFKFCRANYFNLIWTYIFISEHRCVQRCQFPRSPSSFSLRPTAICGTRRCPLRFRLLTRLPLTLLLFFFCVRFIWMQHRLDFDNRLSCLLLMFVNHIQHTILPVIYLTNQGLLACLFLFKFLSHYLLLNKGQVIPRGGQINIFGHFLDRILFIRHYFD